MNNNNKKKQDFSRVPETLKSYPFCVWRYVLVDGKKKKPPYTPRLIDGKYKGAGPNDPGTFGTYEEAVQTYNNAFPYFDGIGIYVVDGLAAIDIDHCIDEEGNLNDIAIDVFNRMDTYSEISPSGTGLRMIALCNPDIYNKDTYKQKITEPEPLEVYVGSESTRYVTLTNDVLGNYDVVDCTKEIKEILDKYLKKPTKKQTNTNKKNYMNNNYSIHLDEDSLLIKALSKNQDFNKLFNCTPSDNDDWSSLDESFFQHAAFWTRCDKQMMENWFYKSNLSHRDKSLRNDYIEMSIQKAIDECDNVYDPNYGRKKGK